MSSRYFSFFPKVYYNGKQVVNITRRAKVLDFLHGKAGNYLSYTIKDGQRAEDIAHLYYGDIGKVWLVYLANDIIDPYSQWPLSTDEFNEFIKTKYKSQSGKVGSNIIRWTQNTTITENILHYRNKEDNELTITTDTYNLNSSLGLVVAEEWEPVRIYDYEFDQNENKRHIYLVNRIYAEQAKDDLQRIMRND